MYRNVAEAIAWLSGAFGFVEHYRYGVGPGEEMAGRSDALRTRVFYAEGIW